MTRRNFLLFSGASSASLLVRKFKHKSAPSKPPLKAVIQPGGEPWIELNLDHLTWNLGQVRKQVKVPVMAVVKANAYGHGLAEVGKHLEKIAIDYLMVGKIEEAILLREKGVSSPILNFGPFSPECSEEIIRNNISQSVFTEEVKELSQTAIKLGKKAKVQVNIDTGLGRMGISYKEALPYLELVSSLKGISMEGILTTLTEDDVFDLEQLSRFRRLCQEAEDKGIPCGLKHAASSDGILDLPSSHLDMVRPGITLYGYYPSEKTQKEDRLALKPVLQLKARVAAVKTLLPGDSISYHRKYTAAKKEKIAVIPLGYSDGYPHNVADKAFVLIGGKKCPLVAAVTANHCIALLGEDSQVSPKDEAVFIGSQARESITADDLALWAEVSNYKILISLNPLLPRVMA
jgi:alanine racemase